MQQPCKEQGFTLIEVLVALAIIAVSRLLLWVMTPATRTAAAMLTAMIALLAAQGRLAELRLEGRLSEGQKTVECDQGRLQLRCDQRIAAGAENRLLQVRILVSDRSREAPALARLETVLSRPLVKPQ